MMMVCRMPTIAHCIEYTREVVFHLRTIRVPNVSKTSPWTRSLWGRCCSMPSVRQFCDRVLDTVESELDLLENRVRRALQASDKHVELQLLIQDWNKAMQFLSCIFYPEEPVVLSRKLVSNRWQLSAKLAAIPCILGCLIPGQPFVMQRFLIFLFPRFGLIMFFTSFGFAETKEHVVSTIRSVHVWVGETRFLHSLSHRSTSFCL